MNNHFKKFLLFNSLLLAQFCFLTNYHDIVPNLVHSEKYSQKSSINSEKLPKKNNSSHQYRELLLLLLISYGCFFSTQTIVKKIKLTNKNRYNKITNILCAKKNKN